MIIKRKCPYCGAMCKATLSEPVNYQYEMMKCYDSCRWVWSEKI
jgi:hypothetical protein